MLLKRMDEIIQEGLFDCAEENPYANVCLVEPFLNQEEIPPEEELQGLSEKELEKKLPKVHWNVIGQTKVRKTVLHYDDTADGSNKYLMSYQNFYSSRKKLGEGVIYSGSSSLFKAGRSTFGGVTKAAIYLRYSAGVMDFLETFDPDCAASLKTEAPLLVRYFGSGTKFPTNWSVFDKKLIPKDAWVLPVICRGKQGYVVPFLRSGAPEDDYEELEDLGIDVERSLALMSFFSPPEERTKEVISGLFQMGEGLGRNPFGRKSADEDSDTEYLRLKGVIPQNQRAALLRFLENPASYKVNVAPNPDSSELIFLPEGDLKFSQLKAFTDAENLQKNLYFEAKKAKKKNGEKEDVEKLAVHPADLIPVHAHSTIFMVNTEGSQKKKLVVQKVFPSVELAYFTRLNDELLNSNLQYYLIRYVSIALTGQESGKTPALYHYWTEIFSKALQKQFISGVELYNRFQQFAKGQSGEKLIKDGSARNYFWIIGKLLRLQHLIAVARETPEELCSEKLKNDLEQIENFEQYPKRGVFKTMADLNVSPEGILGENLTLLREYQRHKLERFIRLAAGNVPDQEFSSFVRGALVGMLLNELCWHVNQQGRRFSATQGRQVARLRGSELTGIFVKGVGLLRNLDCANLFNCQMLPFIKSVEQESRRDAFNNGLIMGMTFIDKKENQEKEEVKND